MRKERGTLHPKDAELLLRSTVLHDYQWLGLHLKKCRRITKEHFERLSPDKQKFLTDNIDSITTQAGREWIIIEELVNDLGEGYKKKSRRCTLCNTLIRYEYFIENHYTREQIRVGSECVKRFGMISNAGKTANEVLKERQRLARQVYLRERFDGIEFAVNNGYQVLENTAVLVPLRLEQPYLKSRMLLKQLYDEFVDGKVKNNENKAFLEEMESVWVDHNDNLQNIMDYDAKYKGHRWRPTQKMRQYFKANNQKRIWEELKKHERITSATLPFVEERSFLNSLVPDWNQVLRNTGITIHGVYEELPAYRYTTHINHRVELSIAHRELASAFGLMLFGRHPKREPTLDFIVINSNIYKETFDPVIDLILEELPIDGYHIHRYYDDSKTVILTNSSNQFWDIDAITLAKNLFPITLGVGEAEILFRDYIEKAKPRMMTLEQLRDFEVARGEFGESQRLGQRRR